MTHRDLPADFPPLRSLDSFPGNLPLQLSAFVGRDEDLAAVCALLERERLVTLIGTGGVGKTRLALQTAAAVLPHYPDGAWFVDLASVGDPDFVAAEIATTMGLPESSEGEREEALVGALTHRHALVVLDNCEHVVDMAAHVADLVVRRCANVTVLATSQEALGVDGEAIYALKPLPASQASRLFTDRAAAVRHEFERTADNAATIDELCRRLDGIPLAIELAAARVASMSPAAILERLDERFRLLAHGRRTAQARHQTLRATVEWSYGLLGPDEQAVFDRLSVFSGDFTLEAAESVVTDDAIDGLDVLDLLDGLVSKSMVALDVTGDRDYYRLLETMRDFGQQRLAERGELARLEERHAGYYRQLAKDAAPHFLLHDDTEWLDRITAEFPNVRTALSFAREHGDPSEYTEFVFALARYWRGQANFREGLSWLTPAFAIDATPSRARAEALAVAGQFAVNMTRYDDATEFLDQSLACSVRVGEPPHQLALMALSLAALLQNRPEETRRFADEGIAAARADGEPYQVGEALSTAAEMIALTTDDPRAIELADEGLVIAREIGNGYLSAFALEVAGIARYRTDPARAIELLTEALNGTRTRNSNLTAQSRFIKAVAHVTLRQYSEAAADLCISLPITQESRGLYYEAMALGLSVAILMRPDPENSVRILALLERAREDGEFVGAPRDLEMQSLRRGRLEARIEPEQFAALWSEGRALTLDDAVAIALDGLAVIAEGG